MSYADVDPVIVSSVEAAIAGRRMRKVGPEWAFQCPSHDDRNPSAMYNPTKKVWHCHVCDASGGVIDLANRLGIQLPERERMERQVEKTYEYSDESGYLLYRVVRTRPKGFYQQRYDNGEWANSMEGVRRVPYRVNEVLVSQQPVIIVEGEKDVDRLWAEGFCATTCAGGAGKRNWQREWCAQLIGRPVFLIPDNDEVGRAWMATLAEEFKRAGHRAVTTLDITGGLPEKGDVSDWFDQGGEASYLRARLEERADRPYQAAEWFLSQSPDDVRPVPTGYRDLDRLTGGGIRPGQLFLLAARPGVGKSALAAGFCHKSAAAGFPSALLSMEMSGYEIAQRLRHYGPWEPGTIFIDEHPSQTIETVEERARTLVEEEAVELLVVDYLQLMDDGGDNRVLGLGKISRGLKKLAKELGIPVIGLCQLNRGIEHRSDRKFQLSDLRESGNLEQDADIVAFLDREELYAEDCVRGSATLHVQKHRNGPQASLPLGFHGPTTRFYDFQEWQSESGGQDPWDEAISTGGGPGLEADSLAVHGEGVSGDGSARAGGLSGVRPEAGAGVDDAGGEEGRLGQLSLA